MSDGPCNDRQLAANAITAGSEEATSTALSKIESNVAPRDFERPNDFEPLEYGKDVVVELESFPTGLPGQPVFWLAALMVRSRNLMSVLHRTVDPVSTNKRWLRLPKSFLGVFADLVKLWKRTFLNGALPRGRSVWAITAPNRGGRSTLILLELLPR